MYSYYYYSAAKCQLYGGLICHTDQYYTNPSDCQTLSGHNSRRSTWGRDR